MVGGWREAEVIAWEVVQTQIDVQTPFNGTYSKPTPFMVHTLFIGSNSFSRSVNIGVRLELRGGEDGRREGGPSDARHRTPRGREKREGSCVEAKRKASQTIRFSWVYRYSVKNTITKESLFSVLGHPVPGKTLKNSEQGIHHRTGILHNS